MRFLGCKRNVEMLVNSLIIILTSIVYIHCQFDEEFDKELQTRNQHLKCGIKGSDQGNTHYPGTHARVINGKETTSRIYPWAAQIFLFVQLKGAKDFSVSSSGTMISNKAIISCAHCICRTILWAIDNLVELMKHYPTTSTATAKKALAEWHTCLQAKEGDMHPVNQNRPNNIISYRIGSDVALINQEHWERLISQYNPKIQAFLYGYDFTWNMKKFGQHMNDLSSGKVGYRSFLKHGEISLIIDESGLSWQPRITWPICLPIAKSFDANKNAKNKGIDVMVVGSGDRYEEYFDEKKKETHSSCVTNEGMVRDPKHGNTPHVFIPCKDYKRSAEDSPNLDVCIPIEKATLNGQTFNSRTFQSMSTDAKITFDDQSNSYNIEDSNSDKCNSYWKKAEESLKRMEKGKRMKLQGNHKTDPVRIIVLDTEKSTANWKGEYNEWVVKGKGPGIRCYDFQQLAANGICKTESIQYPWGFCGRSCAVPTSSAFHLDSLRNNMMELEAIEAKYYDTITASRYVDDTDKGKRQTFCQYRHLFKSCLPKHFKPIFIQTMFPR